jgi:hypothetical protein
MCLAKVEAQASASGLAELGLLLILLVVEVVGGSRPGQPAVIAAGVRAADRKGDWLTGCHLIVVSILSSQRLTNCSMAGQCR